MRRLSGFSSARLLALLASLTLVACADEAPGPQFANEPAATRPTTPTEVVASPAPLPTSFAMATPASVSDLLAVRGAPNRVYAKSGNALWTISSSGQAVRVLEAPQGSEILDFDHAPGSGQVAVLLGAGEEGAREVNVLVLNPSGEIQAQSENLAVAAGTPIPVSVAASGEGIDWSPQGDRLLVSLQGMEVLELPVGDLQAARPLPGSNQIESVVDPTWSPTGESIAYIAAENERSRSLQILDAGEGTVRTIVEPAEGRFVVEFSWMPNGNSVLFTEGGELGGAVSGIDLWRVGADGENRALIVSAGTVAPVARISNVKPSPDGRSVAYAVLVPGADRPQVDSVWVRDLETRLGFRIPLPSLAAVNNIWWTDQGLFIAVTTRSPGAGRPPTDAVLQVDREGAVKVVWAAPVLRATPTSGTPVATPTSG